MTHEGLPDDFKKVGHFDFISAYWNVVVDLLYCANHSHGMQAARTGFDEGLAKGE